MKLAEIWEKDGENDGQLQNLCVGDGIGEEKTRLVACGWAGAIFEATPSFGQEQLGQRLQKQKKVKCDGPTDSWMDQQSGLKSRVARD